MSDANAHDDLSHGAPSAPPANRREIIALQLMRFECDSGAGDWPLDKCRALLAAVTEPHSGDCKKQPWTCCRCVAEDVYRAADAIDEALK